MTATLLKHVAVKTGPNHNTNPKPKIILNPNPNPMKLKTFIQHAVDLPPFLLF